MKNVLFIFGLILGFSILSPDKAFAQIPSNIDSTKTYVVTKNDGTKFMGRILKIDSKEVLIVTKNLGEVAIPKHEVKEIKEVGVGEVSKNGEYIPEEVFSTRYFFTTNGLPIKKGESYVQWNLFGPDFQFAVGDNFGMGVMTSWIGMPIIGSAKYSFKLSDKANFGIGTLLGTGSWAAPDFALALPFGVLSLGNRRSNISFSGGYGAVIIDGDAEGRALLSVGAMAKVGSKISVVFDSFIVPPKGGGSEGFALLIPGLRWQMESNKAFQFGFGGIVFDGEVIPAPIPLVQFFRKI